MNETRPQIRIAVNTMRARLTVIGFNLAIITFQITHLLAVRSGAQLPDFHPSLHVAAMVALYFALLLSISAMVLFIVSGKLSDDGICDSSAVIAGDLLMYLGLAYGLVGFFQPIINDLSAHELPSAEETAAYKSLLTLISNGTAVVWTLVAFVGPGVSLVRSPFSFRRNVALGVGYLILMMVLGHFWGIASELQASLENKPVTAWPWIRTFFMPIDWLAP